jgi:hypothetical protein
MPDSAEPSETHPRGTLVVVSVFGVLVVAGWLLCFFALFVPRMTP